MNVDDELSLEVAAEYVEHFKKVLGIDEETIKWLGIVAKDITQAEWKLKGDIDYYKTSLFVPLRNLYYSTLTARKRWEHISSIWGTLKEPILDYGCGIGFTLMYLQRKGYDKLYGFEIEGIQKDLTKPVLWANNIEYAITCGNYNEHMVEPYHYGTILCLNTLEHLKDPLYVAKQLHSQCDQLIANCDLDIEGDHPSSVEYRQQVIKWLDERGCLWGK